MAKRYQGGILGVGFNPLRAPNAPTIGTAVGGNTSATVPFTAPACVGGSAITSYAVQSTPGGIGATGSSSPITVSGLTNGTAYTFRVTALNSYGPSPASASSNSVTPVVAVVGQQAYTTPGTYSWVAPAGVTAVSAVVVGAGGNGTAGFCDPSCICCTGGYGGGGGGLAYLNNYSVTPGSSYTVVVPAGGSGGCVSFVGPTYLRAGSGSTISAGGFGVGTAGASGGNGGIPCRIPGGGGGGAAGYTGNGGAGGNANGSSSAAAACSGGAGGGGGGACLGGAGGGGVGILGKGSSGAAVARGIGGTAGSGGTAGTNATGSNGSAGGAYGGGGGGGRRNGSGAAGAGGAVRIIWPGNTRSFPSTCTGNL